MVLASETLVNGYWFYTTEYGDFGGKKFSKLQESPHQTTLRDG